MEFRRGRHERTAAEEEPPNVEEFDQGALVGRELVLGNLCQGVIWLA
jgi:hypothetical protein